MNIIENNKLIAEFMGLKPKCEMDGVYSYLDMPFFSIRENDIDKVIEEIAKYSKYHSSWEWLMKVVEKIEGLTLIETYGEFNKKEAIAKISVSIEKGFCQILSNGLYLNEVISIEGETKIQSVYYACVEFIKWYNNQNKN